MDGHDMELLNLKVTEVKAVDVTDTDTDSDYVESYEGQVPNSKGSI